MCGIAGIISFNKSIVLESELQSMGEMIKHRGPDGNGTWISEDKCTGFAHRRLSVIDLSENASQPMHYKHLTITYNGEIYNYKEIRSELENLGHQFKTTSDTEVLLVAYLQYGISFFDKLDGMFAFAIYNELTKETLIARDRFGEKPLFYRHNKDELLFASEIKSIAQIRRGLKINEKALYRYLVYDLVQNPDDLSETFYQGISNLLPGHYILFKDEIEVKKYWNFKPKIEYKGSLEEASIEFSTLFEDSISKRLRSDVFVGTSLSGGLDSSSIVANICGTGVNDLQTFTARFKDEKFDEGKFVDLLSDNYKFQRNDVWPNPESLVKNIEKIFYHQEEPFGSSSIFAQWEVMKMAHEKKVTVLMDGQGGDEVLGGYFKYFIPALHGQLKKHPFKTYADIKKLNAALGYNPKSKEMLQIIYPKYYDKLRNSGIVSSTKKLLDSSLHPEFATIGSSISNPFHTFSNLNEALWHDTTVYGLGKLLRYSDRNSMAFSREVRLPYLSYKMVEFIFKLPDNYKINFPWTKFILRKSMENKLPKEVNWRKDKMGFSPPQNDWMKTNSLKALYQESKEELNQHLLIKNFENFSRWQIIMSAQLLKFTQQFK